MTYHPVIIHQLYKIPPFYHPTIIWHTIPSSSTKSHQSRILFIINNPTDQHPPFLPSYMSLAFCQHYYRFGIFSISHFNAHINHQSPPTIFSHSHDITFFHHPHLPWPHPLLITITILRQSNLTQNHIPVSVTFHQSHHINSLLTNLHQPNLPWHHSSPIIITNYHTSPNLHQSYHITCFVEYSLEFLAGSRGTPLVCRGR